LTSFDDFVTHFNVIHWPEMEPTCATRDAQCGDVIGHND
jgi:hypothetical protein